MVRILKFRLTNLYTIIIVIKIKISLLKKKEKVKGFFIFMTMPSFKQVESNYGKGAADRVVVKLLSFLVV